ncbi:MAG: hypothetical protein JKY48_09355 [Flavobacteriales bacterium]|nr:hypothetical protein [Flavobacteriales bacterium]
MKIKLRSLLIAFVLVAGFQTYCQAQMTVTNNSGCMIYVSTIQVDMYTPNRCDWCNISTITTILPGASVVFPRDIACGREVWSLLGWGTNLFGLSSSSWNPVYQGACSPDVLMANCGFGSPILSANWLQSGAGAIQVVIS